MSLPRWEIVLAIFLGGLGLIATVFDIVGYLGFILLAVAVALGVHWWLAGWKQRIVQKTISDLAAQTPPSGQIANAESTGTWLQDRAEYNRKNLPSLIKTLSSSWACDGLRSSEPHLDAIRELWNGSMFDVRITGVEGVFEIGGVACQVSASTTGLALSRYTSANIRITQPVTPETARGLRDKIKAQEEQLVENHELLHGRRAVPLALISLAQCHYILKVDDPDERVQSAQVVVGRPEEPLRC